MVRCGPASPRATRTTPRQVPQGTQVPWPTLLLADACSPTPPRSVSSLQLQPLHTSWSPSLGKNRPFESWLLMASRQPLDCTATHMLPLPLRARRCRPFLLASGPRGPLPLRLPGSPWPVPQRPCSPGGPLPQKPPELLGLAALHSNEHTCCDYPPGPRQQGWAWSPLTPGCPGPDSAWCGGVGTSAGFCLLMVLGAQAWEWHLDQTLQFEKPENLTFSDLFEFL